MNLTSSRPLKVLIADDNPVNLELIAYVLRKLGHRAEVVATGQEALDAVARDSFDVLLMDLSMPGMDGLEATRRLRETEAATGRRLKVIALTAHDFAGSGEQCRAAGMDGFISKPLEVESLCAAIERLARECAVNSPAAGQERRSPPVDGAVAMGAAALTARGSDAADQLHRRFRGDAAALRGVARIYREHSPRQVSAIREALAREDWKALSLAAHSLKGTVGILHFRSAHAAAQALEHAARGANPQLCRESFQRLTAELEDVNRAMQSLDVPGSDS